MYVSFCRPPLAITHVRMYMFIVIIMLAPEETASLTTLYQKSYEYEEIQTVLEPLLNKAFHEPREMTPKFNSYFPWQV